ncbi:hypothetical protein DFH09DRAFT_1172035 [Mycena vulgaris]|nr:hypothetical protein DFH09DRAFT_1172035 [Mycena vulgaris]
MACITVTVKFGFHDSISLLFASGILFSCRARGIRAPPSSSVRPRSFASIAVLVACTLSAPMVPGASPVLTSLLRGERGFGAFLCIIDHVHLILGRIRSRWCALAAPVSSVYLLERPVLSPGVSACAPCPCTSRLGMGRDAVAEDCILTGELRRRACDSSCSHSAAVLILSH